MVKYIDADKLSKAIEEKGLDCSFALKMERLDTLALIDSLQQEQDRRRYCIEYINPQYPLLDNGELNIRHLRIPDEHSAEMALTLMLSFGAKIYALYRGNVKDGKLGEWPTPMIVDTDDWCSTDWLHDILDCGCTL